MYRRAYSIQVVWFMLQVHARMIGSGHRRRLFALQLQHNDPLFPSLLSRLPNSFVRACWLDMQKEEDPEGSQITRLHLC
jgi:hypothetical protein